MVDEVTNKRIDQFSRKFVDIYTEGGEANPEEAGAWARNNVPKDLLFGKDTLPVFQEKIKEYMEEAGFVIEDEEQEEGA